MAPTPAPTALDGIDSDDITEQAVDILAGLTSLGISSALREKVQEALHQLDNATASASAAVPELKSKPAARSSPQKRPAAAQKKGPTGGKPPSDKGRVGAGKKAPGAAAAQHDELENKLAMSRSIMRKLYRKNVELEKEVQMLTANGCAVSSLELTPKEDAAPASPAVAAAGGNGVGDVASRAPSAPASGLPITGSAGGAAPLTSRPSGGGSVVSSDAGNLPSPSKPVALAIQERDRTITQLQAALDASRRRCALLEGQASGGDASSATGGSKAAAAQQASIREVLATSQLHLSKYQNIREDYNRLLKRRTATVSTSKAASAEARALVDEMHSRLSKEMQEREAEAALYSARLYESERQMSDWYVEKRMLEQQIERLTEEVAQRDHMDQEMEACVCDLFERLRLMEDTNKQLSAKLEAAGAVK